MTYQKICLTALLWCALASADALGSLAVHPVTLRDTVDAGGTKSTVLHITNLGPATPLDYTVSVGAAWLSAAPTSGQIAVGETADVIITYDATTLSPGSHVNTVTVGDPHHGGIDVVVTLTVQTATSVGPEPVPEAYDLKQNFPNPFNPGTRITYSIPSRQFVSLKVYNLLGQEVAALVSKEQSAGPYTVAWDASTLPTGVFLYRLQAGSFVTVKRMLLLK
jgi:hypothetical protein